MAVKTLIETLKTYIDIAELAKIENLRIVEADYLDMIDNLEYQIWLEFVEEV